MKITDLDISISYDGKNFGRTPLYRVGIKYTKYGKETHCTYDYLTKTTAVTIISDFIDYLGTYKEEE